MKKLLSLSVYVAVLFSLQTAWGLGGPSAPSGNGSGRPKCAFYDRGFEEHGYHRTLAECNAKHHNSCEEQCYEYSYTCTANGQDASSMTQTVTAIQFDEFYARNEALDRCYRSGLRNCSISRCDEDSRRIR